MRKFWAVLSSRRGRSVVAVLVLGLVGVGAVNLDHRTTLERAEAWAAAHPNALPRTLEELAAYPVEYRQPIFEALPAAEQSRLWRVQLQRVLDTEPNLTADQRVFLVNTMALATPVSFMKDMPKPEVCDDLGRLFTNANQRQKVRTIATGIAPAASFSATWVKVSERVRTTVMLGAAEFPCSCRGQGVCECGLLSPCLNGDCNHTMDCGCIWAGECDKMCGSIIGEMKTGGNGNGKQ